VSTGNLYILHPVVVRDIQQTAFKPEWSILRCVLVRRALPTVKAGMYSQCKSCTCRALLLLGEALQKIIDRR